MNCTARFRKQFPDSSPCLPWQQGTGQQGRYTNWTLRKQMTNLLYIAVQFILSPSIVPPAFHPPRPFIALSFFCSASSARRPLSTGASSSRTIREIESSSSFWSGPPVAFRSQSSPMGNWLEINDFRAEYIRPIHLNVTQYQLTPQLAKERCETYISSRRRRTPSYLI